MQDLLIVKENLDRILNIEDEKKPKKKYKTRDKSFCIKAKFILCSFYNLLWGLKGFGNIPTSKMQECVTICPVCQKLHPLVLTIVLRKEFLT